MSKAVQTFVSYKYLKDATGLQYLVITSHVSNPVSRVLSLGKGLVLTFKSSTSLKDGNVEKVYTYTGSGSVEITFKNSQTTNINIFDIPKGSELTVPFDSLDRSFTFDISSDSLLGYDISDALFYSEGTSKYKESYVLPQSSNPHLDTSSRTDFYYLTDGSTAYIASTSLQNKFLNNIGYSNKGSDKNDLGRFRGGTDDNTSIEFSISHQTPVGGETTGPLTRGGIVALSFIPRQNPAGESRNTNRVCLDPQASNYYLTGCVNEELPCVDSGTTHANDCLGVALTADRINDNINADGSCCEYTTGCEDYDVIVTSIGDATVADDGTANGFITVDVINGTQNYTVTVDETGTGIDDPNVSFSTITMNNVATDEITIPSSPSLHPGYYSISVTDSTAGTACIKRFEVYIPLKPGGGNDGEGDFGCKSTSTAINHDSSVDTHQDSLCVFCDANSGLLFADANNPTFLGNAFDIGAMSTENAGVTPEGVSVASGSITGTGVDILNFNHVLSDDPNLHIFNPEEEFVTNQVTPFDKTLYRIDSDIAGLQAEIDAGPEGNAKAWLTANATDLGTSGSNGMFFVQGALGPGQYVFLYKWDADGTQDGDPEEEQCYAVTPVVTIYQKGCTDPDANNYNTDYDTIPQFFLPSEGCVYTEPENERTCEDPGIVFDAVVSCDADDGTIQIGSVDFVTLNPTIYDAGVNGFIVTQSNHPSLPQGSPIPGSAGQSAFWYIAWELFCYDIFNSSIDPSMQALGLPVGFPGGYINSEGVVPSDSTGNYANMYRIVSTVTFADGTDLFLGETPLGELLPNTVPFDSPNHVNYGQITCDHISTHGAPTSVTFDYNYGEYNVYGESASYTHIFTAAQLQQFTGCCEFSEPDIEGCTDPTASNYNPAATVDDGSCQYPEPPETPGCTDPTATNYNPLATIDDGSCEYIQQGSWVQFDCDKCIYDEFYSNGFATEQECEASIEPNSDCCIISTSLIGQDGVLTASSAGSTSVFNVVTGLCDDQSTGQLQITLPNLTDLIANTGCLTYWWKVEHSVTGQFYSNLWGGIAVDAITADGFYTDMDTSDLITPTGGVGQDSILLTGIPHGVYNVYVYFMDICFSNDETQIQDPFGFCRILSTVMTVSLDGCTDNNVYDCTDPESPDYNPLATIDDGSCTYPEPPPPPTGCDCGDGTYSVQCCPPDPVCGCPDPNASNYNPNATYYDPTADGCGCEYDGDPPYIGDPPEVTTVLACVPRAVDKLIAYNNECIARVGHRFYTKHITGLGNSCSNMETMKMVIINDLISRKGLPCIFNCSDNDTPAPDTASNVCKDNWIDSGSLFWNPANAAAGLFNLGVHVRRPFTPNPQGLPAPIYVAISNAGLDIDPFSNDSSSGWKLCKTESIINEKNNYLPNFLKFAHEYCKDCGIPPYRTSDISSSSVTDTFATGGSDITQGGVSFENTSDQSGLTDQSSSDEADEGLGSQLYS